MFFDVCSSPSPGAVRSDFDMKAQSFSDLSFFPAFVSLSVRCLRTFEKQMGAPHVMQRYKGPRVVPWLLSPRQACAPWFGGLCISESLSA